ncbi:LysR family transcriptional regulator [Streptomyces sp. NPDC058695]|uniref:LysR family transcriptional regulator n=1 Tax=Streptomyces sp. NPDC058695 TaxID=3346604 RepID=UPI0036668841
MGITLRQIEIFVTAAEHLHLGRAAEALHISRPTVSQEVSRLERGPGRALFDRPGRSASLTPNGDAMAVEGRMLLSRTTGGVLTPTTKPRAPLRLTPSGSAGHALSTAPAPPRRPRLGQARG